METYYKNLDESMPYIEDNYLTVGEFRGSSDSNVLWTDRRLMEAFNKLRNLIFPAEIQGFSMFAVPTLFFEIKISVFNPIKLHFHPIYYIIYPDSSCY